MSDEASGSKGNEPAKVELQGKKGEHAPVAGRSPADGPSKDKPNQSTEPKTEIKDGDQADAKAIADDRDPGNLDGLVKALTSDVERRTRTLQAAALESARQHLGPTTERALIGNQVFNLSVGLSDQAAPEEKSRPIARATLERLRETFVAPAGYVRLWRHIEDKPLLVLRAAIGSGRTYTALHLLDAICAGRVHQYSGTTDMSRLAQSDFAEGTGYLMIDLPERHVRATQAHELEAISERLHRRDARLVIITADDVAAAWCPAFADYVDELSAPPLVAEVLRRHLLTGLRAEHHERALTLLDDPDVAVVLTSMVADRCSVAEVYEFACRLKRVVLDELRLPDVCATADRSAARIATWFQGLREPEDRTFAVALGVLNGLPYATVAAAGETLWAQIQRVERPHKPPRVRVFCRTTQQLLDAARAEVVDGSEDTGYGTVPARAVRSMIDKYPQRLLRLLWAEYPGMHSTLTSWLRELASDPDPRVRARAATAAGVIAEADFFRTYEHILLPWASSWKSEDRQAAVAALWMPALDPAYAAMVWNVVDDWLDENQDLPLRLTATAALGASVGRTNYLRALRLLGKCAETNNYRLKQAICQAVTDLFTAPTVEQAGQVLDAVAAWATERRLLQVQTALGCFLQMALDPEWAPLEGDERWPLLMRLVDNDADRRGLAIRLWRQAMNRPGFGGAAVEVLHDWVRAAEDRPYLRGPLCALAVAIPGSVRDRRTLRYYLREWAAGDDPLPMTAELLLDALPLLEVISSEPA
jgi:hypothetical protein